MYVKQFLLDALFEQLQANKVLIIYGARRVGKTTLLTHFLAKQENYLFVNGEDRDVQYYLSSQSISLLKNFIGSHRLLVIDEAQAIPQVGQNLKLLVDHCPGLAIVVTGSSAFALANHLGEPLTGRQKILTLFPLSQLELNTIENPVQVRANLEQRLIYGAYPEAVLLESLTEKKAYLQELARSYLYKDILELEGIRKSQKLEKMLQLLAFQIGKEVSLSEIGTLVGLHKDTISHYLDLLEKAFVLMNVTGFSRNLRKEITKKSRYYFYDTGIRNAIINQFSPLTLRNDVGELWENYLAIERIKKQYYTQTRANNYYWRTYDGQEIDWIEDRNGQLEAYEFKWKLTKEKPPAKWLEGYPSANFLVVHRDNYMDFIT